MELWKLSWCVGSHGRAETSDPGFSETRQFEIVPNRAKTAIGRPKTARSPNLFRRNFFCLVFQIQLYLILMKRPTTVVVMLISMQQIVTFEYFYHYFYWSLRLITFHDGFSFHADFVLSQSNTEKNLSKTRRFSRMTYVLCGAVWHEEIYPDLKDSRILVIKGPHTLAIVM